MKKVGDKPRKSSDSPSPPFNRAEYQAPEPDVDSVTLPKAAPGNIRECNHIIIIISKKEVLEICWYSI